jgi:hypothetical protein
MRISMSKTVVQESNGARVEFSISPAAPANISQGDRCIAFLRGGPVFPQDRPGAPDQPKNVCKACWGGPGAKQKRMQNMLGRAPGKPKTYAKHARASLGPANKCVQIMLGRARAGRKRMQSMLGRAVQQTGCGRPPRRQGVVQMRGAPCQPTRNSK